MKIISLIPLTSGTGICHYISSFAKIEMNEMAILDLDSNSILRDMLKAENTRIFGNDTSDNESDKYHLKVHTTRFNNKLITRTAHSPGAFKNVRLENMLEYFISRLTNENFSYLIIHYPYKYHDSSIDRIIATSDYTVLFSVYTLEAKLAMKDILSRQSIEITRQKVKLHTQQIEQFGEIPYNLIFQLATIQKKVLLEFGDNALSDSIVKLWEWTKSKLNSPSKKLGIVLSNYA